MVVHRTQNAPRVHTLLMSDIDARPKVAPALRLLRNYLLPPSGRIKFLGNDPATF